MSDEVTAALRTLVDLHDGPRDAAYTRSKEAAWQAARDALAALDDPVRRLDRPAWTARVEPRTGYHSLDHSLGGGVRRVEHAGRFAEPEPLHRLHPCCLVHDDEPCPQDWQGHELPCNGPGAPVTCNLLPLRDPDGHA